VTIAAFYDYAAADGRAVVVGTHERPAEWIVRVRNAVGDVGYWHCASANCEIRRVDPVLEVAVLPRLINLGGRPPKTPLAVHAKMSASAYLR
jgi:hypothetical protein